MKPLSNGGQFGLEELEPRVLLSASVLAAGAGAAGHAASHHSDVVTEVKVQADSVADTNMILRMSLRGAGQMPPLATKNVDPTGLRTVTAWLDVLHATSDAGTDGGADAAHP